MHLHFGNRSSIARRNVCHCKNNTALMSHIDLDQAGDEEGICDILAICILVTSWIVPVLRKSVTKDL